MDESSGGKVLKLKLDFDMALDDHSSFLALKAMSNNRNDWGDWVVFYNIEDAMHL